MSSFECRIKATLNSEAVLGHLNATGQVPFDHYHESEGLYVLTLTDEEIRLLERHGIEVERGVDLAAMADRRKAERAPRRIADDVDDALTTGFVDQYLDAAGVNARVAALAAEFPALCHLSTLPHPTAGYDGAEPGIAGPADVQLLRITDDPADHARPGFLLICGTHAREWVNPLIAIEFAEQLLRNYDPASADPDVATITRIIEEGDVFIVPVLNPDGLNFSFHDDAGWRKNRRPNVAMPSCPGVDNNRNFEIYFGDAGSSPDACSEAYHGPAAVSEPENQNIRYLLEQFPNILIGVDSHSQGQKIFRPTASGGVAIGSLPVFPDDETIYADLEAAAVAAIQTVAGTTYATGTTSNHAGTSDEYMFFGHRVFGFDFECALSHQPPIASALIAVQEGTAALRTLALKAVDLDVEATVPVRIVQCIDRTGSMVTFGYEETARANARRFVDLMSIGDSAAVVSFADPSPDPAATPPEDRALVEFPLTPIDDAGDFAAVRASIDGIAFGGWTSIGAGLAKAADQVVGAAAPRAVVLLSDGFENRLPSAADVLTTFPPDLPVYTVAMGTLADVPLLQQIATATGGQFYLSPSALELHEIYNQIRADASADDLVLNVVVAAGDDDAMDVHPVYLETGAAKLTVSISRDEQGRQPNLVVLDPSGRVVTDGDWGTRRIEGDGYTLLQISRPMPGQWLVCPHRVPAPYVIGAFVRSPVRLHMRTNLDWRDEECVASIEVNVDLPDGSSPRLSGHASLTKVLPADNGFPFESARGGLEWIDTLAKDVRLDREPASFERGSRGTKRFAALRPVDRPATDRGLKRLDEAGEWGRLCFAGPLSPGVYTARLRVAGWIGGAFRFERVALSTLMIRK